MTPDHTEIVRAGPLLRVHSVQLATLLGVQLCPIPKNVVRNMTKIHAFKKANLKVIHHGNTFLRRRASEQPCGSP